jgi:hypothetical protein
MIDIYSEININDINYRFLLGKSGINPLVVMAMNPSVATKDKWDQTVLKAFGLGSILGYDGCIIMNLLPCRASNSSNIPEVIDQSLLTRNINEISSQISSLNITTVHILACWGEISSTDLMKRRSLNEICIRLNNSDKIFNWFCLKDTKSGRILTEGGYPRHFSRLMETSRLESFDINDYLDTYIRELH